MLDMRESMLSEVIKWVSGSKVTLQADPAEWHLQDYEVAGMHQTTVQGSLHGISEPIGEWSLMFEFSFTRLRGSKEGMIVSFFIRNHTGNVEYLKEPEFLDPYIGIGMEVGPKVNDLAGTFAWLVGDHIFSIVDIDVDWVGSSEE
jgi:hypothetical protein